MTRTAKALAHAPTPRKSRWQARRDQAPRSLWPERRRDAHDSVEAGRRQPGADGVAAAELDVRQALGRGLRAGLFKQGLGEVDPEYMAAGSNRAGGGYRRGPRAAAQVEHALPGLQGKPRDGRSAEPVPETERSESVVVGRRTVGPGCAQRVLRQPVLRQPVLQQLGLQQLGLQQLV